MGQIPHSTERVSSSGRERLEINGTDLFTEIDAILVIK